MDKIKEEFLNSCSIKLFSGSVQKEFRAKSVLDWSVSDVCDWLDSLFMPEYKVGLSYDYI